MTCAAASRFTRAMMTPPAVPGRPWDGRTCASGVHAPKAWGSISNIEADAQRLHLSAHMITASRAQIPVLLTAFLTAHGFGGAPGHKPRLTFRPAGVALCYVGRGG
jgi:hypothetical protein